MPCVLYMPTVYAIVHCKLYITPLLLPSSSSAWEGFANATDLNKIQSFINKSKSAGYCSSDLHDFENLSTSMNGDLFNKVLNILTHVLHPLLPPPNSIQPYSLRTRAYNRTLPQRKSHLVDCNFVIRMLYLNAY